jgi:hypothetical protein
MEYVLHIEAGLFLGWMLFAKSMDLGEAGNARPYLQTLTLPLRVIPDSQSGLRARAYERHITAQHIPQLRQFRQTPPHKKPFVTGCIGCMAIYIKPPHAERYTILPTARLGSERPSLFPVNKERAQDEQRRKKCQYSQAQTKVHSSLESKFCGGGTPLSQQE